MDFVGEFNYVFREHNGAKKRRYKMKCYAVYMGEKLSTESVWSLPSGFNMGVDIYSKLKQKTTKQMKLLLSELFMNDVRDYDYDLRSDKWGFPVIPEKRTEEEEQKIKERLDKELDEIEISIKKSYEK